MRVVKQDGLPDLIFLEESDLYASPPCSGYITDPNGTHVGKNGRKMRPCDRETRHHYQIRCEVGHSKWTFHCDYHRDLLLAGRLYHTNCDSYAWYRLIP